jgi:hypothetical protein
MTTDVVAPYCERCRSVYRFTRWLPLRAKHPQPTSILYRADAGRPRVLPVERIVGELRGWADVRRSYGQLRVAERMLAQAELLELEYGVSNRFTRSNQHRLRRRVACLGAWDVYHWWLRQREGNGHMRATVTMRSAR